MTNEVPSLTGLCFLAAFGGYLDTPIRTYSTGMRLILAIVRARKPDIFLLDESIGVGEANFYLKAVARLLNLLLQSRIMVVASHSRAIIKEFCNKAIWLHQGSPIAFGGVEDVLATREGKVPAVSEAVS
jgi:ABC-type polysaccharide/polyol phosphate transport system ATPase subunit